VRLPPEHPVLVVHLVDEPGRSFRALPDEVQANDNNLSTATGMGITDRKPSRLSRDTPNFSRRVLAVDSRRQCDIGEH